MSAVTPPPSMPPRREGEEPAAVASAVPSGRRIGWGVGLLLRSRRLFILFSVLGPGIIAANADNDASGIYGYSLAGAKYGYSLLWILVLSTFALGIMQEICARMGAVTGRGLADLIREEYGVKVASLAMAVLLIANFATTVSEFAGILAAVALFVPVLVTRFVVLPLVGLGVWLAVARGSYRRLERILLGASLIYLLYIVSAFMAHPTWPVVFHQMFVPNLSHIGPMRDYVFALINVVGTTITPWGQFYIQSSVRDKGVGPKEYPLLRADVLFGAFFTNFIAFFIVVCCGRTLYPAGIHSFDDAGQAASALAPLVGHWASVLFAIGLLNASCFGAITVPLSTAYAVTESLGWEGGLGRRTREAPLFTGIFTFLVAASALVVMLFPARFTTILILLPNIVGAMLLPIILVLMLLLFNKRRLMREWTPGPGYLAVAWLTTAILAVLSLTVMVTTLLPSGGGGGQ